MVAASCTPAQSRPPTRRDPLARYCPRSFKQDSWWRFRRNRRALYLSQVHGEPTSQQAAVIETLVAFEWNALRCEHEGGMVAYREGRELRRNFIRELAAFEKSLAALPAARRLTDDEIADAFVNRSAAA